MGVSWEDEEDVIDGKENGDGSRDGQKPSRRTCRCVKLSGTSRDAHRLLGSQFRMREAGDLRCQCWAFPKGGTRGSGVRPSQERFSRAGVNW